MEEENILSKSNIKKAVVKILKNNPNIDKISVETFSRVIPSFYPALCVEIYGKYLNETKCEGDFYNDAKSLFRKINGEPGLVHEIKNLDMSQFDDRCENESIVNFRFIELTKRAETDSENEEDKKVK